MAMSGMLAELEQRLPPLVPRKELRRLLGGLINPRTIANLDSKGLGPAVRLRYGRQVVYEKASFIEWLEGRLNPIERTASGEAGEAR